MQPPEQNSLPVHQSSPAKIWQLDSGEGSSKSSGSNFTINVGNQRLSSVGRLDQERPSVLTGTYPSILSSNSISATDSQNQHILLSVAAANSSSVPLAISALSRTPQQELLPPPPVHVPTTSVINFNPNDYRASIVTQLRPTLTNAAAIALNALTNKPT